MPLKVLSEALGLPDPVNRINEPSWAFAQTLNLGTATGLLAWRSLIVRDDDPMYANVREVIDRNRLEVLIDVELDDPSVIYGRLRGSVSLLHPKGLDLEPSPQHRAFYEIFSQWGEAVAVQHVAEKIKARCLHLTK